MRARNFWVVLGAAALLSVSAAGDPPPPGGVPRHVLAMFNAATCPTGWAEATAARGRLMVGVDSGAFTNVPVGVPLGDREDRTHTHTFSGTVTPTVKSISAASGGNNSAAQSAPSSWSTPGAAAPSGLPFIQLLVCEKQ
jgi:hypothetical protein